MKPLCLFLDLDGTLLELAGQPSAVVTPRELPGILADTAQLLRGASAIVSGRNVEVVDQILYPFRGNTVGVHGLERRLDGADIERLASDGPPAALAAAVRQIAAQFDGSIVEDKGGALAVHERVDAISAQRLFGLVEAAAAAFSPDWHCLRGHRLIEIKPARVSKGTAVSWLLRQPVFVDCLPVAIGDDITDLDMFAIVEARSGLTISVGDRIAGTGRVQMESPEQVMAFLKAWIASRCRDSIDMLADIARSVADGGRC